MKNKWIKLTITYLIALIVSIICAVIFNEYKFVGIVVILAIGLGYCVCRLDYDHEISQWKRLNNDSVASSNEEK